MTIASPLPLFSSLHAVALSFGPSCTELLLKFAYLHRFPLTNTGMAVLTLAMQDKESVLFCMIGGKLKSNDDHGL